MCCRGRTGEVLDLANWLFLYYFALYRFPGFALMILARPCWFLSLLLSLLQVDGKKMG